MSSSSFYNQNTPVYTDTNPAGPADTPVSGVSPPAPSSFFGNTGQPYANVETVQATYADMVAAETAAAASAAAAHVSETNAAASATGAAASKTAADTDATNAAASASGAAGSQSAAATSATNAAASASAASTSATSASGSATAAASSASGASTSATNAASSASAASTSATNAAGSATAAATSASNASAAAVTEVANRAVRYDAAQTLTTGQKSQAQTNMGLGTAAPLNVGTGANNIVQLNASSQLPAVSGALLTNIPSGVVRNFLSGLTLSTAGSSTTFSVAAGVTAASDNSLMMTLAASISKTTAAWAVGSAAGSLDTGTIAASTWYHVWLIERTDTGVVDVLTSLSATAPTMPTNYTKQRRIGSMKTNASSQWTFFHQVGDEFLWDVRSGDVAGIASTTTSVLTSLSVPTGVQVRAEFSLRVDYATLAAAVLITSPDESDQSATTQIQTVTATSTASSATAALIVRTNTSAQVRLKSSAAGCTIYITTYGWLDDRGKSA